MMFSVDQDRIVREIDRLAAFSNAAAPAVTRIVFSREDMSARAWLKGLCEDAGLGVRTDLAGTTFARWVGSEPCGAAVATGSHIDAIPDSGRYDGTVGVLGGLEAIRFLKTSGFQPRRSIELLIFTAEEPTRFGVGCLGSRLLAGALTPEAADGLRDSSGKSLCKVREEAGFPGSLDNVRLSPQSYAAFVELHIEQGPLLERDHIELGIVTHIAAPASLRIRLEGEGGHAGAVLMRSRRDAFLAAAEVALAVEAAALATGFEDTVATVGVCQVYPGAVNSIPSYVAIEVDVRDIDPERRDRVLDAITQSCQIIAAKRQVSIVTEILSADAPAACDSQIMQAIEESCKAQRRSYRQMISRAYHDSLLMSRICPVGMIFIPCKNGVSHRPDEYASPEDIANGTRVLAETLARLAG